MFDYILHKANGIDKVELNQQIPTFRVVTSLLFEAEWQIEEKISLSIISATPLDFGIGDWIEYHGKKYQVFTNYSNSGLITDNRYTYKITFYSPERWYKKANMYNTSEIIDESQTSGYRWERVDNETVSNGDIVSLGNQLCYNLNASQERRVFKLGDVPEALIGVYKEFTFSDPNCLVCLHEICEAFDTFYNIRTNLVGDTDYVIDFGYEPGYFPVTLKYGKKQGLYSLKLNNADEEVYTIFVVRGSTENLPSTYPKLRLSLNDSYPDSVISCPDKFARWGKSVKELTYEDIKPERTGEVTGIIPDNINAFIDSTLTFSPVGGTIKFLSGPMIGHTLECVGYNEITHTVTLKPYEDSNHFVIPNPDSEAYRINVGDKYNIDGIGLPQSYVTDAENRLLARPQKDIEYYSQPRASYDTRIERELIQEENVFPEIGMFVHIVHENLDIDKFLRVRRITQNILGTKPVYESFEVSDLEYQKADVRMYKKAVQAHLEAKNNKKKTDNAILTLKEYAIEKAADAQTASEAYAAAQAEAARVAAQAYADGEIDAEEARAIADATAKMNEAKSYAESQASAAESAASTYAAAQAEAARLAAIASAKTYTDTEVASAKGYADSTAAAAQSAAEAYALAKANLAETNSEAYADGIVDAEEAARIAEAQAKLNEAKTYAETKATAAETAAKAYADTQLGNFATTVTADISDLQNQIDGSITTHFYAYVPTTANAPASGWTTTALKNQHLGDLFYNTSTGFCYRYQLVSSVYSWQRITDSDITKALADAAAAQDTADSKRRVFVATPVTPYDVGDLWLKTGDLYKCKVTRATGSYVASDWEKGVKYTDDTVANANLVTAKAYADTKKAEAIAAAEAAAEAEALAAQTAAEAHADGIVTAEEQARIADVNAKLAAAKTYAETKATEAKNAAEAAAAALDDAIQVGGRNLLRNSGVTVQNSSYPIKIYDLTKAIPEGTQVTVTIEGVLAPEKNSFMLYNSGGSIKITDVYHSDEVSTGVYRKTFNWVVGASTNTRLSIFPGPSSVVATSTINRIKLEVGNKATDWTPAPEDVQADIATAAAAAVTTAASDATSKMNAAKDALAQEAGYTNFADMQNKADLTVNGLLNSQIINVDDLFANTAFVTKLVAFSAFIENLLVKQLETDTDTNGWTVRIDNTSTGFIPSIRLCRRVDGVIVQTAISIASIGGIPQMIMNCTGSNCNDISYTENGIAFNLPGGTFSITPHGIEAKKTDGTVVLSFQFDIMTGASFIKIASIAGGYSSSNPHLVWKDSKGILRLGAAVAYTAADVGALPTNTIQYFTQAQWAALTQAQKDAVPLALVQE